VVTFSSGESESAVITGFTIQGGSGNALKSSLLMIEGEMQDVPSLWRWYYHSQRQFADNHKNVIVNNVAERGGLRR
jgi:hypothetical protein